MVRLASNAVVNGLCSPVPSSAVEPALAAYAINVPVPVGSTLPSPAVTERLAGLALSPHVHDEGIVAASVENNEAQPSRRFDRLDKTVEWNRLIGASKSLASLASTGIM